METEIIAGKVAGTTSELAMAEDIRRFFASHREELRWLAGFLTNDATVTEACLFEASAMAAALGEKSCECLVTCACATVTSAIGIEKRRIAQFAPVYEGRICDHGDHPHLSFAAIDFLVQNSEMLQPRLDVLCRFALIMCGIERYPSCEAARQLGISPNAVEAAYCVALAGLDILQCELLVKSSACGMYN